MALLLPACRPYTKHALGANRLPWVSTILPGAALPAQASLAEIKPRLIDVHHHFSQPFYGKETDPASLGD